MVEIKNTTFKPHGPKDFTIELLARKSEEELRTKKIKIMLEWSHEKKMLHSKALISEFIQTLGTENVYVSTSGGKDSACLSKLCKSINPEIKHVMFNTGLEYRATIKLAEEQGAEIIPTKTSWLKFCEQNGFPVGSKQVSRRLHDANNTPIGCAISLFSFNYGLANKWLHFLDPDLFDLPISHLCCTEFKKKPGKKLKMNPIVGTRIEESEGRKTAWKKSGCNTYSIDYTHGVSKPISLWRDHDVDQFVKQENIALSEIYTQYQQKRTGCVICPYGAQSKEDTRFDLLRKLEPKRYEYFMTTPLKRILALSNVIIKTDEEYMIYKECVQESVRKWHEKNKGDDEENKYLIWKCMYALNWFTKDQIKNAVIHISKNKLKYDLNDICTCLDQLNEK